MKQRLEIKIIEKIAKTLIFISTVLMLSFFALSLYCSFNRENLSIGGNYSILGLLVNIGVLTLIFVSLYEFIRTYREAVKK